MRGVGVSVGVLVSLLALFGSAQAQMETALNNVLDLTHVITASDPTRMGRIRHVGEEERHMWLVVDGRWAPGDYPAQVFTVSCNTVQVEFQVHAELGDRAAARDLVDIYARIFGQMPLALIRHLREVEIHATGGSSMSARGYDKGDPSAGSVSINTAAIADVDLVGRGFAEEYALHEAAHVSWDPEHRRAPGWLKAQQADPGFITPYAKDHPEREDLADTAVAWFAVRYRPDRISPSQYDAIIETIPNRLAYLDRYGFDMSPYVHAAPVPALPVGGALLLGALLLWRGAVRARSRSGGLSSCR